MDLTFVFNSHHVVLPVIHLDTPEQAIRQAAVAREAGAHGVFIVNHNSTWEHLAVAVTAVRTHVGGWIGANALDLDAVGAFSTLAARVELDGVWTDDAGIDEYATAQPFAERVDAARAGFAGLYFGGVAFKYQREVQDLTTAARIAASHMDVVCTSGPGTGLEASPLKISEIAAAAFPVPTSIASGVSVENVAALADARVFIVASSICSDWTTLDPVRTRALVERVAELNDFRRVAPVC